MSVVDPMNNVQTAVPIVRAAVAALDDSGATTPRQARTLLGLRARRDQLTADQVAQVLSHYGDQDSAASPPAPDTDPNGWTYTRNDEPPVVSLPAHAAGYRVGKRWPGSSVRAGRHS